MKEIYEQVEINIDIFDDTDVITASFPEQHDNTYVNGKSLFGEGEDYPWSELGLSPVE